MNKLDIDEVTFFAHAVYVQQQRGYKPAWCSVIFKVNFGDYPPKEMLETQPIKPSIPFIGWLNHYEDECAIKNREQIEKLRQERAEKVANIEKAKAKSLMQQWSIDNKKTQN